MVNACVVLFNVSSPVCTMCAINCSSKIAGAFALAHSLGNTLMFYKQFSEAVERAMQSLVAPVTKEFNVGSSEGIYAEYGDASMLCVNCRTVS